MNSKDDKSCPAIQAVLKCSSDCLGCASYKRKFKEAEQTLSGRDGLIQMLQDQIKKYENNYKDLLDEFEQMRFRYCSAIQELSSLKEINKKLEEENERAVKKDTNKIYPSLENLQDDLRNCKNQCKDLTNKLNYLNKDNTSSSNSGYKDILNEVANIENLIATQTSTLKGMLNDVLNEVSNENRKCVCKNYLEKVFASKSTDVENLDNKGNEIRELQKEIQTLTNLVDKYKVENENIRGQLLKKESSLTTCLCDNDVISKEKAGCQAEIDQLRKVLRRKDSEIYELKQKIDALEKESEEKENIFNDCRCRLTDQICQLQENNALLGDTLTIVTQENKSNLENANNLRRSLSDAEKRLDETRYESNVKYNEFSATVEDYKENEKAMNEEIARLRRQIDQYRRQTDELRDRINDGSSKLSQEMIILRKELEEKTLENTEYEEENRFYCQKIDALMKTIKELQLRTKSDSATQAEISRILNGVQTDEDGRIIQIQNANKSLEDKLQEISALQKHMEARTSDYDKIKTRMGELRQSSLDLENENSLLMDKFNFSQEQLRKKDAEFKEACCDKEKLQKQVSDLLIEHDDKTDKIREISMELTKLRQSITGEEELKDRIKELEMENSRLLQELSTMQKCHCSDITELLNKEIERLQGDNNKKQSMIGELEEIVDRAKKIMCECEEEVKTLAAENKTLKDNLSRYVTDKEELDRVNEHYRRKSDQLQSEFDKLWKKGEEEKENYRRESQQFQMEKDILSKKHSSILDENKSKSAQLDSMKKKISALELENKSLQAKIVELKKEIAHYNDLLESNSAQFRRQSETHENKYNKLSEDFEITLRKFSNAEDETKDWKNRYNKLEAEQNELNEIYTDLLKSYKIKCNELQKLKEEYEICCDTNREQLDALHKGLSKSQSETIEARRQADYLQEEIEKCRCEIDETKENYDARCGDLSSEITMLKDVQSKLEHEYRKKCEEYEVCCNTTESEIAKLRSDLAKSQSDTIEARRATENVKEEMDKCLCEVNEEKENYKYKCGALTEEILSLTEDYKKLKKEYESKCHEFEVCCNKSAGEMEMLRRNLSKSQDETMQARRLTEDLRKEMDRCLCEINKEKDNYVAQCADLTSQLDEIKTELHNLKMEYKKKCNDYELLKNEFQRCCNDSAFEIDALKGKLSASQSEAIEARRMAENIREETARCICELEEHVNGYKRRCEDLTIEKNKLQDEHRLSLENQQTTSEELEQLKNKYKILSEQYKQKISELSTIKEKFDHCCTQTSQEISHLMRKLNMSQTEAIEGRTENSKLRQEISRCICEIDTMKTTYRKQKEQLDSQNDKLNEQYRTSLLLQQNTQDDLQQLRNKYKILGEQYKNKITELSNLREQCALSSKKCQISRDEYNNLKKEYKEIKAMLSDQIRKYREDIAATRDTDCCKRQKSASIHDLKQQLVEKEVQIKTLSVRVKEQEQEIDYLKENYQKLHTENNILKAAINNLISNIEHKIRGSDTGLKGSSAEMIASEILHSLANIEDQIASKTSSLPRCNCIQEIMSKYGVAEECSGIECKQYCNKMLRSDVLIGPDSPHQVGHEIPSRSEGTSTISFCDNNICDCAEVLAGDMTGLNNIVVDLDMDGNEILRNRCVRIEHGLPASAMKDENRYKQIKVISPSSEHHTDIEYPNLEAESSFIVETLD